MLFRRIVLSALLVGAVSGLALSAVQRWQVIPIIDAAERFEEARASQAGAAVHDHAGHDHGGPAAEWEPEGTVRIGLTILSNVLIAAGFALVMLAAMSASLRRAIMMRGKAAMRLDWRSGILWGLAGYAVFFVAPTLGLPPDIPGAVRAPLEARELWWVLTVVCTAAGLAGAAFLKSPWRWAALALLLVPHLIGAPHPGVSPFAVYPPEVAAELTKLARRFLWASALANGLFWIVLGSASVWAVRRFVKDALV